MFTRFRAISFLLLLIAGNICFNSLGQNNLPYINPTPGEITIVASTPIPHGITATHQAYVDLIDCGFNIGMEGGDLNYYKKQFEAIGDLDFKYIVDNSALLTDNRTRYIKELEGNKHFAGWKFKDEPKYDDLDELAKQYKALYKADPNNLIYMNLIGGLNNRFTGDLKSFPAYLQLIEEKFAPPVWSYDYYPVSIKNRQISVDLTNFYYDLECFMEISQKTGRPFWAYCQSMAYKSSYVERPAATEQYLRFEAFSALAYGAQGIVYWTYGQRKSNTAETYFSALVNSDGKKSPAWYAAKKVNAEIKKYNDVFYGCKVIGVRHTGNTNFKTTKKLTGEIGPFKSITAEKSGVLVSKIENQDNTYYVIVSHDVLANQKVTLTLSPNRKVTDLTSNNNRIYSTETPFTLTLDKGGYIIFKES